MCLLCFKCLIILKGQPIKEPPGCPPGPPPEIDSDGEVEDYSAQETEEIEEKAEETGPSQEESSVETATVKPTSLQQKMVALSGQNVDEFMKEMETVQKKGETEKEEDNRYLTIFTFQFLKI